MSNPNPSDAKWTERSSANQEALRDAGSMFQLLFERSADAIVLFDPEANVFVDCNDAAVKLMRAKTREQLLNASPADLSPPLQPDGRCSREKAAEITALVQRNGSHRFEWLARRFDGTEAPLETIATAIPMGGRVMHVVVPRDISERQRAEEEVRKLNLTLEQRVAERTAELRASEAQFRTLVEHAPEAIVVLDGMSGRFEAANENASRLFGRSREELLRLTPTDVSPFYQPDGRPSAAVAREMMDAALRGEMPVFEWQHVHTSGRSVNTEVRLVRLPGERCCLVRASIIDHTERKRREQVQQATYEISEAVHMAEDLDRLYERIHQTIDGLMPAGNFYIALFDAKTEMISFPYFVDESEPAPAPFRLGAGLTSHVIRTGKPLLVGAEMNARKRRVGTEVTFDGFPDLRYTEVGNVAAIWLGVPLMLAGRTIGVMAVQDYHDSRAYGDEEKQILTFVAAQTASAIERKRAQEALRESEEKFRALFEATSQGVMLHDEERFLEVNPAVVRILGFQSAEEILGKHPSDTAPPFQPNGESSATLARQHITECMQKGHARFDWVCRNTKGQDIPIEVILTRIEMGGRRIIQAVINDITERKRAEAEVWRALGREKELSQLKSNFVSMVSHEFRTPLGIIQSSSEILSDYFEQLTPAEREDHLKSIARNTRRMADLMEEVLVLSQLDAGKMDYKPAPIDLRVLCQRIADEVLAANDHRCPIELQTAHLPSRALADERLLRHIFTNLLSNALKYSEPGRPVQFRVDADGCHAVCVVRDQGIGIGEADQKSLFTAFYRGQNVGQRPGTGLGLVIVKRCVELHRGQIVIESRVGEGTTVTVRLPVFPSAPIG